MNPTVPNRKLGSAGRTFNGMNGTAELAAGRSGATFGLDDFFSSTDDRPVRHIKETKAPAL